jgi:hypothetical protein
MAEVQRVRLKKIYLGRIALFGLAYGSIIGVILGIIAAIFSFISLSGSGLFGMTLASNVVFKASLVIGLIVMILMVILSSVSFVIISAIYNLISRLKLMIDIDFMEYEEKSKEEIPDQKTASQN